MAEARAIKCGT